MWDVWKIHVCYAKFYETQEKSLLFKGSTIHYGLGCSWLRLYMWKILLFNVRSYEAQEWSTIHYGLGCGWLQLYSRQIVPLSRHPLTTCPATCRSEILIETLPIYFCVVPNIQNHKRNFTTICEKYFCVLTDLRNHKSMVHPLTSLLAAQKF